VSYCLLGRSILGSNGTIGLNLTACNNVILVDLWWNPALEVRHVVSPPPSQLHVDLTTLLGSSVWTSAPHWAEEAGEYMEAHDRGHGGGTDSTCTCFATPICELGPYTPDSFRSKSANWRSPRYLGKPGARLGLWVWTSSWICSSRTTTTKRTERIRFLLWSALLSHLSLPIILLSARFYGYRRPAPGGNAPAQLIPSSDAY